jgi:hypothetical protein
MTYFDRMQRPTVDHEIKTQTTTHQRPALDRLPSSSGTNGTETGSQAGNSKPQAPAPKKED